MIIQINYLISCSIGYSNHLNDINIIIPGFTDNFENTMGEFSKVIKVLSEESKNKDLYSNKIFNSFLMVSTFASIFIYSYSIIFKISTNIKMRVAMFLIPIFGLMILYTFRSEDPSFESFRNEFHRFYSNHKILFLLNFILIGLFIFYSKQVIKYFLKPFFLVCFLSVLFLISHVRFEASSDTKKNNIPSALLASVSITGLFSIYFYTFYKYNLKNKYHLTIFAAIFLLSFLRSYRDSKLGDDIFQVIIKNVHPVKILIFLAVLILIKSIVLFLFSLIIYCILLALCLLRNSYIDLKTLQ